MMNARMIEYKYKKNKTLTQGSLNFDASLLLYSERIISRDLKLKLLQNVFVQKCHSAEINFYLNGKSFQ